MDVRLTEGAIQKICAGEYRDDAWTPILQVLDVRMVNTARSSSDKPGAEQERYRVLISDGSHHQQGMLGTQKNALVQQGRLQKGSIVCLKQFTCTQVQNRLIIIIIDLDLVLDNCEMIGDPVAGPKYLTFQPSMASPGNPQSLGGSAHSGGAVHQPVTATAPEQPRVNQSSHGSCDPGRYATMSMPPVHTKPDPNYGAPGSAPLSGSYSNQNTGFRIASSEVLQPPLNSYDHPPLISYARPSQPPPMYSNIGPIAKIETPARIVPINALNPYQGVWTIKARVTAKTELRHYNNARGDGKVFSVDLLDSDDGEIRATCFNAVADQFYSQIEVGKIYMISGGTLKPAQKKFNHLNNDHEILLDMKSIVRLCFQDNDKSIPQQNFRFCPINNVERLENNTVVDVIGVVSSISTAASIMRKNGIETQKRTLQLKDMSGRSVEVTLWGNLCNEEGQRLQILCDSGSFPVLALKGGRVNDFNGKGVATVSSSQLLIEPNIDKAHEVRKWFDMEGRNTPCISISRETAGGGRTDVRKTVSQIKDDRLGTSDKPDWITVGATLSFIRTESFCYTACPIMVGDRQCFKKVTNNGDGKWRCERCDQTVDECDYRYILQLQIQDHTGLTWVTAFQETGEEIMGVSAKTLYSLRHEEQNEEKFAEIIRNVLFTKFIFKLKIKEELFSDEQRIKSIVTKVEKVNFPSESKFYLGLMDKLTLENFSSAPKCDEVIPSTGINDSGVGPAPATNVGYSNNPGRELNFGAPENQGGQCGNQYSSDRFLSTGSAGSYVSCNSCGHAGHSSMNCPSVINGRGQLSGGGYNNMVPSRPTVGNASGDCYKCHQPGHWARDCPGLNATLAYGSSSVNSGRYRDGF